MAQLGAPILEQVQMPDPPPLDGTFILPARKNAYGTFGDIYRATWILNEDESIVCVKCIRPNLRGRPVNGLTNEERLERRLKRETLVWRNANHPNIYPYLGYKVVNGETWLVSPWTESGSLDDYLEDNQDLDSAAKLRLLRDAAQGLAYLHRHEPSIVHGDISPRNILIRIIDNVATAALCDFGLSRIITEVDVRTGLTTSGAAFGVVGFSAAELFTGNTPPTPMSDVHAFGGVMLFAMSGETPFHHYPTGAAIIFALGQNEQPQATDHPGLPENDPLWQLLRQCWNPIPTERPTAEGVIARLTELIAGN